MPNYWIGVASREHVLRGASGGFCQVCHGKAGPLKLMAAEDWIIYYSPTETFGTSIPCQKFTAIGKICAGEPYAFRMSEDFIPWRRNVLFFAAKEVSIQRLIPHLSFIKNKQRWGFPFRRGCFAISRGDFKLIAQQMDVQIYDSI